MHRKTNIELMRILSIYLIIVFHCAYKSGFAFAPYFSINKFVVKVFWMFGELGVNLFILITGYFMVKRSYRVKKLILLVAEVLFYHQATIFIAYKLGIYNYSGKKQIFLSFFPITTNMYWFITAYIITYLLSPYLNMFACKMTKEEFKRFLFLVLALFSGIPTIFGVFYNSSETMLYYNRLIWFFIMYLIGSYIRIYGMHVISSQKYACKLSTVSFLVLVFSILVIEKFDTFFARLGTSEVSYLWGPNTIPMFLLSIGTFGIFLHWEMKEVRVINRIASTTLGIYILHDGLLSGWLWKTVFRCADYQDSPTLPFRILASCMCILCIGGIIDLIRQIVGRRLFYILFNKHKDCIKTA